MKVLFLTTMAGVPWGGSELLWSKMAEDLLKQGHTVHASIYKWEKTPSKVVDLQKKGLIVHFRYRTNYSKNIYKVIGKLIEKVVSPFQLKKLHKINPDVVFFSLGSAFDLSSNLYFNFIKSLNTTYYCYLSLNTEYEVLPYHLIVRQREVFNKSQTVFFPSFRNLQTAKRQLCSLIENSKVINNPITFNNLEILPCKSFDKICFSMVARLDAFVKGQPIVLEILSSTYWKNKNWELNIFGEGPDKEYILELIKFYNLSDKVNLIGFVSDIRNQIWKENHILLMPSQYEGCPISLYDAAIAGRIAVVSNVGGNAEFVIDGVNGFVSDAPSVHSFGAAMQKCWENIDNYNQLAANARSKALNTLDLTPEITVNNIILENYGNR